MLARAIKYEKGVKSAACLLRQLNWELAVQTQFDDGFLKQSCSTSVAGTCHQKRLVEVYALIQ